MCGTHLWSYEFISVPGQLFHTPNDFFDPKQVSKAHYVGHESPRFFLGVELRNLPGHDGSYCHMEAKHCIAKKAISGTTMFNHLEPVLWLAASLMVQPLVKFGFFGSGHPLLLRPALEGCGIHHLVALHSETLAPKPKYFLQRWETNHKESPQRGWTPGLRSAGMFARAKSK